MAMGFRERAREEGEARMKYKRRGRWEGYSGWLALYGPIMAGTHCPSYERGYGVRASVTSQPAPIVSPCAPLLTREALSVCAATLDYMPQNKVGRVPSEAPYDKYLVLVSL